MGLPIVRTPIVDDNGSGTTGSIWNNAWMTALYDAIDAAVAGLRCSAFHSTTQSISNATVTAVSLDSESFDVGAFHSTSSNTSRLTVPAGGGGVYVVVGELTLAASAGGTVRQCSLAVNGTAVDTIQLAPSTLSLRPQILAVVSVVVGDYLEMLVYQDSGGALNIGSGSAAFVNRLTAIKVG